MNFEKNHREHTYTEKNVHYFVHFCISKATNSERTPRTLSSSEPREIAFNAKRAQKKGYLQSTAKGSK